MRPAAVQHAAARPRWALAALAAMVLGLGACTTVKLVPESLDCPVPEARLAEACPAPGDLPDGASFQDLIRVSIADRQALQLCELRRKELAAAIRTCNQAVAEHLKVLREINAGNQGAASAR